MWPLASSFANSAGFPFVWQIVASWDHFQIHVARSRSKSKKFAIIDKQTKSTPTCNKIRRLNASMTLEAVRAVGSVRAVSALIWVPVVDSCSVAYRYAEKRKVLLIIQSKEEINSLTSISEITRKPSNNQATIHMTITAKNQARFLRGVSVVTSNPSSFRMPRRRG